MEGDPEPVLTRDCLIYIFSYLEADDLRRVSQVNEAWNDAAETPWLWRRLCLERWIFCNISNVDSEVNSWKKYYLHRSKTEQHMASGRSTADYNCTTFRGHSDSITGLQYLSNPDHQFDTGICKSLVCTASRDGTLRAWSVQEGKQLWSTPVQEEPLVKLITVPQKDLAITADSKGKIKVWNGQTGEELAAYDTSCTVGHLVTCKVDNQLYLTAGTRRGALITLTIPNLSQISHLSVVKDYQVDFLLVSPNQQWIIAGTEESNDIPAKVLRTELLSNSVVDDRLSTDSLPLSSCFMACWLPKKPSRVVTVTHSNGMSSEITIVTFDINLQKTKQKLEIQAKQVGNFSCKTTGWNNNILVEGHGINTIILVHSTELKLFSIDGTHYASFRDHKETITGISVDPFRVVTASMDLSLRVYTWKRQANQCLNLESNYHLLGGSHLRSRGFKNVLCDYVSIVGAVQSKDGKDVLKAYNFNL
ncbi:F-box/WD repeat-containing protein 12 isoform X1 [Hemiscyllium ocellatum]|uniref:F-box/WD repeat-containing protein 12 isoform X1 n=1 Tax=Hemiscyllium ocellatum TaxID=170820 RepID=UPI002965D57C|nr:F-box/WD repeat-containing protein 12 isoform X1 [Hemiscyllium ocellatum]